ncbi:hypothetical protein MGYG_09160 [Nannizzia gypsea CBS 118893]|uniref:Uncharacterized protein n=1 Tax=Arthroderma gypseum (strain ATCC MYA-4604 / CBS 118893) TaxID=535722 RepID=E4V3F6_ARTGP|nr:hypothetical protein MGYG_09160 [Nannizzia gypsea CBS 118893]EFR04530.1 hypothetical protein MGYG_09160 [Nannizzia gypsea CBS 118893]
MPRALYTWPLQLGMGAGGKSLKSRWNAVTKPKKNPMKHHNGCTGGGAILFRQIDNLAAIARQVNDRDILIVIIQYNDALLSLLAVPDGAVGGTVTPLAITRPCIFFIWPDSHFNASAASILHVHLTTRYALDLIRRPDKFVHRSFS